MKVVRDISPLDDLAFFREATSRLCGTLQLEGVLASLREVLLRHGVPVEEVFAQVYEESLASMRVLGIASAKRAWILDRLTALPEAVRDRMKARGAAWEPLYHFSRIADDPVGAEMARDYGLPDDAAGLLVPLVLPEASFGQVVLISHTGAFDDHAASLVVGIREPLTIAIANALQHRELARLRQQLGSDNRYLRGRLRETIGATVIGADGGLAPTMVLIGHVAGQDTPVMLLGETGVGKDLLAHAVHDHSPRRDGPFVPVNCGALPPGLVDSELFGHERGAFTGATQVHRGLFERADGGTLFLDEVGELPGEVQVRLLRVLQENEVSRFGGTEALPVDVRVVVATHRDLEARVRSGDFREDLWFRLNVFPIVVPPLRERRRDIPALVDHVLRTKAPSLRMAEPPALAVGEIDALLDWPWPGNVRELANLLERALILHRGGPLRVAELLHPKPTTSASPVTREAAAPGPPAWKLDDMLRSHLQRALAETGGRISGAGGAAELLGMNPSTLRSKLRKLGVKTTRRPRPRT